jgi:hypothetical protein
MPEPGFFDLNITLSDSAQAWAASSILSSSSPDGLGQPEPEFDLDAKYSIEYKEPTGEPGNEIWASGIFGVTCGNTCQVGATCTCTCGNTCQVIATCTCTCGNTCGVTCGNTCQIIATCTCTCGNTCGITCGSTCGLTCGNTCGLTCGCTADDDDDSWLGDDDDDG